jgi:hypothetical protein
MNREPIPGNGDRRLDLDEELARAYHAAAQQAKRNWREYAIPPGGAPGLLPRPTIPQQLPGRRGRGIG